MKIENLKAGSFEKLLLTVNSSEQGIKNCTLNASSSQYSSEIFLIIDSKTSQEQLEESREEHPETREIKTSCSDLKGMICTKDKECSVETTTTIDGSCCTGQCKEAKKSSTGKTIAIIAIVIVIIIIAFFVIKKLKLKNKTSKDLYEEKSKSYEERFKPSSEEVRGKLTRI